jgi:hypothetical protein
MIVEIDEAAVSKPKYNVGAGWATPRRWVFGLIEEQDGDVFMREVPNRRANTLRPIILRHVLPATMIHSDMWPTYNQIPNWVDTITNQPMNYGHAW